MRENSPRRTAPPAWFVRVTEPRSMEACNVESFEDSDGHAVDALSHANVEASSAARAAPAVDDAAGNGANALDTSLASDSAGVLRVPCACCTCPRWFSRMH